MRRARPDLSVACEVDGSPRAKVVAVWGQRVFLGLLSVLTLAWMGVLPAAASDAVWSYGRVAMLAVLVGTQLAGSGAATGNFDVYDDEGGALLFSKRAEGRMPSTAEVLALLPLPRDPPPAGRAL